MVRKPLQNASTAWSDINHERHQQNMSNVNHHLCADQCTPWCHACLFICWSVCLFDKKLNCLDESVKACSGIGHAKTVPGWACRKGTGLHVPQLAQLHLTFCQTPMQRMRSNLFQWTRLQSNIDCAKWTQGVLVCVSLAHTAGAMRAVNMNHQQREWKTICFIGWKCKVQSNSNCFCDPA